MKIIFLGTNGWYSTTATGITPCILIDAKNFYLVLDAGEGIYKLDKYITDDKKPIYIFLSHFHLEHIHGLHILNKFHFKQPVKILGKIGTVKIVNLIANDPFTDKLSDLPYKVEVVEFNEGEYEEPLRFSCKLLPHPDKSMGYRFEIDGKIIAYCTDTGQHENVLELARNADVFISECAHRSGEYSDRWPHMNPEDAAKTAKEANSKRLVLMHFAADRYPTLSDRKEAEKIAKKIFENTIAAVDDLKLEI